MPLARLERTISVYQSDTRSITTLDSKDPVPSRYPSYPAHRVQFSLKYTHNSLTIQTQFYFQCALSAVSIAHITKIPRDLSLSGIHLFQFQRQVLLCYNVNLVLFLIYPCLSFKCVQNLATMWAQFCLPCQPSSVLIACINHILKREFSFCFQCVSS